MVSRQNLHWILPQTASRTAERKIQMNLVMISIHPKWCGLIASGEKTIEVRRTRPKFDTSFMCYIYCTKERSKNALHLYINETNKREKYGTTNHWRSGDDVVEVNSHLPAYRFNSYLAEGKVIGVFTCDKIYELAPLNHAPDDVEQQACLSQEEIARYLKGKGYAWHITNVKIFNEPWSLDQCLRSRTEHCGWGECDLCKYGYEDENAEYGYGCRNVITRPPQSWMYIEKGEL